MFILWYKYSRKQFYFYCCMFILFYFCFFKGFSQIVYSHSDIQIGIIREHTHITEEKGHARPWLNFLASVSVIWRLMLKSPISLLPFRINYNRLSKRKCLTNRTNIGLIVPMFLITPLSQKLMNWCIWIPYMCMKIVNFVKLIFSMEILIFNEYVIWILWYKCTGRCLSSYLIFYCDE